MSASEWVGTVTTAYYSDYWLWELFRDQVFEHLMAVGSKWGWSSPVYLLFSDFFMLYDNAATSDSMTYDSLMEDQADMVAALEPYDLDAWLYGSHPDLGLLSDDSYSFIYNSWMAILDYDPDLTFDLLSRLWERSAEHAYDIVHIPDTVARALDKLLLTYPEQSSALTRFWLDMLAEYDPDTYMLLTAGDTGPLDFILDMLLGVRELDWSDYASRLLKPLEMLFYYLFKAGE